MSASQSAGAGSQASGRRGRPLRDDDADPATERRRARVRQAQHALRQRKEAFVSSLEQQVKELQDTLEAMSNAFMEFNDSVMNTDLPQTNPDVIAHLRTALDRFVTLARTATRYPEDAEELPSSTQGRATPSARNQLSLLRLSKYESNRSFSSANPVQGSSGHSQNLPEQPRGIDPLGQFAALVSSPTQSPHMEQWLRFSSSTGGADLAQSCGLNFGLWRESFKPWQSTSMSSELLAFLVTDIPSFAARLFFCNVFYGYRVLTEDNALANKAAKKLFALRRRYESRNNILDSVCKSLYYMLQYKSPVNWRREKISAKVDLQALQATSEPFESVSIDKQWLDAVIMEDLAKKGENVSEYLNSWDVETYLKNSWGFHLDTDVLPKYTVDLPTEAGQDQIVREMESGWTGGAGAQYMSVDMAADIDIYDLQTLPFFSLDVEDSLDLTSLDINSLFGGAGVELVAEYQTPLYQHHQRATAFQSSQSIATDVENLIGRLRTAAIGFGNGPKFSKEAVDAAAYDFLQDHWAKTSQSGIQSQPYLPMPVTSAA